MGCGESGTKAGDGLRREATAGHVGGLEGDGRGVEGVRFLRGVAGIALSFLATLFWRLSFVCLCVRSVSVSNHLCPGATQVGPRDRKNTVRLMTLNAVWVRDPAGSVR